MNWSQLSAIIWLRWRLTRNQFARAGKLNAIIVLIGSVVSIVLTIGAGVGGVFGGALGLSHASPLATLGVCDGIVLLFIFTWIMGVVVEIQRSESLDIARMLHLPVSLKGVFVMNYFASLLTFSIILFLPGTMGLCVGLLWAKGPLMLLMVPLFLSFLFLVTAWTYCLRGWLVTVMVNPRRRRNIVFGIVMTMVLLGQAPNIYFNVFFRQQRKQREQVEKDLGNPVKDATRLTRLPASATQASDSRKRILAEWIQAQTYVPVFWLPKGAMALAEGDAWPAILGSAGAFLLGVAGLARAYRTTIRFYQGQEKTGAVKQAVPSPRGRARKNFIEKRVPFVTEDVAALTLAFFRSLSRAPEIKMSLFSSVLMIAALAPVMLLTGFKLTGENAQLFVTTGAVGFTFFGMVQPMFNQFGFDRDGFRALVLSPARRQNIVFAKNLALAPVAIVLGMCFLAVLWWAADLPLLLILAALCQLAAAYLLLSIAGNFISIWVPYRVVTGSLKATKPPAKTVFVILLTQFLFPIVMVPVFIAPLLGLVCGKLGWLPAPAADLLASLGLLAIAAAMYRLSLNDLGRMLEQREKNILLVVSQEAE